MKPLELAFVITAERWYVPIGGELCIYQCTTLPEVKLAILQRPGQPEQHTYLFQGKNHTRETLYVALQQAGLADMNEQLYRALLERRKRKRDARTNSLRNQILDYLRQYKGQKVSTHELCNKLHVEHAVVLKHIHRLSEQNLILREPLQNPFDGFRCWVEVAHATRAV